MNITLNGKPHTMKPLGSVAQLVESLGVKLQVAVAVNGEVVRRADWASIELSEGDEVEIVRAVGGGS